VAEVESVECAGGCGVKEVVKEDSVGFSKCLSGRGEESGGDFFWNKTANDNCTYKWGMWAPEEVKPSFQ
jgi:hypothetical protein